METTLVSVTLISLAMAAVLSAILWPTLREERRRSDARVAALAEMAARPEPRPAPPALGKAVTTRIATGAGVSPRRAVAPPRFAAVDEDFTDLDLPLCAPLAAREALAVPSLFVSPSRPSPWGRRVAVMGGLAVLAASAVFLLLTSNRQTSRGARVAAETPPAVAAGATAGIGLELLSLRDTRQPGSLTITGLVQNPRDGASLEHVTVTAYTFDEHGAFLASGRAPIEVTALAPGDESAFVLTVPMIESVARYRIGFRGEDGRVIAHIDKRQSGPVAANW